MHTKAKVKTKVGRPAARLGLGARELLLNAATELFAESGAGATTFAMIAKRAGLTPAMLHYYFKDRDELFDAVVEERLLPLIRNVWGPVHAGEDAAQIVEGVVGRLLEGVEKAPWLPSTWMREILNEGGALRERILERLPYEKLRILGNAIARGQKDGLLNPAIVPLLAVPSTIGLAMLHMATANTWAAILHQAPLSREAMRKHITGLLLDGLCHKGRASAKTISREKK
ncbi:transcriptional regulator, TetR family [Candidatus Koribacter versatilis Ellin345]|uniref:Transcriptional regulator, TetR family n=1 Tax=Koribacter versatilis (strain Ellin345) TaxID=204669 RepID=Q1IQY1_KORVE|nr:TetR/AcrR family transcriptional regulator [Candidatus Koribacter versatilis]ABF40719.1 transcriptional regulator, TetR family [Candidatus Koribacter versatilis Ellin345]